MRNWNEEFFGQIKWTSLKIHPQQPVNTTLLALEYLQVVVGLTGTSNYFFPALPGSCLFSQMIFCPQEVVWVTAGNGSHSHHSKDIHTRNPGLNQGVCLHMSKQVFILSTSIQFIRTNFFFLPFKHSQEDKKQLSKDQEVSAELILTALNKHE